MRILSSREFIFGAFNFSQTELFTATRGIIIAKLGTEYFSFLSLFTLSLFFFSYGELLPRSIPFEDTNELREEEGARG